MSTLDLTTETVQRIIASIRLSVDRVHVVQISKHEIRISFTTGDYAILLQLDDHLPFEQQKMSVDSAVCHQGAIALMSLVGYKRLIILMQKLYEAIQDTERSRTYGV